MDRPVLPVWRTIADSFVFLLTNWRYALRVGWVAVLVTIAVDLLFDLPAEFGEWSLLQRVFIGLLKMLACIPAVAAAVVPWHRFILLNERPVGARLGRHGRSYILRVTSLYAVCWAVTWLSIIPSAMVGYPAANNLPVTMLAILAGYFSFGGYLAASVGFVLLSPMLPAVAVGQYQGVKHALDLSRGRRLRLVAISFAVIFPAYLIVSAIASLGAGIFVGYGAYLLNAVHAIYFVFQALIAATAVSLCYLRLGGTIE